MEVEAARGPAQTMCCTGGIARSDGIQQQLHRLTVLSPAFVYRYYARASDSIMYRVTIRVAVVLVTLKLLILPNF